VRYFFLVVLLLTSESRQSSSQRSAVVARQTGSFQDARLIESSGVIASRTHPGLLWTINDSGNDPELFLTDTTGKSLSTITVRGAVNIDWEAIGRGGCGPVECLIIGDIGDNAEKRQSIVLYRVPEPEPDRQARLTPKAVALQVRYPDRPHDAEALYVEPDGGVVLVTKGRSGGVLTFRVPASAWGTRTTFTATRLERLPIAASMVRGRVVTDAGISPDGRRVAIRTYREIVFFTRNQAGKLDPDPKMPSCDLAGLEPQGEGLDWWDGETLVLTSERGLTPAGTISLVQCPVR
jgi:hypothetical protein